jgi:hypothetical protein
MGPGRSYTTAGATNAAGAHTRVVGNYGIDPSWGKERQRLALIEKSTTR